MSTKPVSDSRASSRLKRLADESTGSELVSPSDLNGKDLEDFRQALEEAARQTGKKGTWAGERPPSVKKKREEGGGAAEYATPMDAVYEAEL